MASRKSASSLKLNSVDDDVDHSNDTSSPEKATTKDIPTQIYWGNVTKFAALHLGAIYGLKLCFTAPKWTTLAWGKC